MNPVLTRGQLLLVTIFIAIISCRANESHVGSAAYKWLHYYSYVLLLLLLSTHAAQQLTRDCLCLCNITGINNSLDTFWIVSINSTTNWGHSQSVSQQYQQRQPQPHEHMSSAIGTINSIVCSVVGSFVRMDRPSSVHVLHTDTDCHSSPAATFTGLVDWNGVFGGNWSHWPYYPYISTCSCHCSTSAQPHRIVFFMKYQFAETLKPEYLLL